MKIDLPFGNASLPVEIPDEKVCGIAKPKDFPAPADAGMIIRGALAHPIGADPLLSVASRGSKIAIVVDDQTRPSPTKDMIAPVLEELKKAGVRDEDITIIFAVGTHRQTEPDEARRLLGRDVSAKYRWIAGDCKKDEDFISVGRTSRGNDIRIFRPYAEADVKVMLGDIEYHYFAGYGGGRKSILPGISHYSTIQFNHKLMFSPTGKENCRIGVLSGNPVNADMVEALRLVGCDLCLNAVLNSKGQVFAAFAGMPDQVLRNGAAIVDQMYKVQVKEKADIIVVSPGGAPHDISLYQSEKAIESAMPALSEGGIVILAAECREGAGSDAYCEWMKKYSCSGDMEKELRREFVIGTHKAYYHRRALEKARLFLCSSMDKTLAKDVFGMESFASVTEALAMAMHDSPGKVLVVPYGASTLLSVETSEQKQAEAGQ